MVEVKLKYMGIFQDFTKQKEESIRLEDPMIKDLINLLGRKYGVQFKDIFINPENNQFKQGMMILVNGKRSDLESKLNGGEEVVFISAIAGGNFLSSNKPKHILKNEE